MTEQTRSTADTESFINDLDQSEIDVLVDLIAKIESTQVDAAHGRPIYSVDEMNLIARFQKFTEDHPSAAFSDVDVDEDGTEPEIIESVDEDGTEPETL